MKEASFHLEVGHRALQVEDIAQVACRSGTKILIADEAIRRTEAGRRALVDRINAGQVVYGVTTGFGDSCQTSVDGNLIAQLPQNLYRFHGCGVGDDFSPEQTRAILLCRLSSLSKGYSAVRGGVLTGLAQLIEHDILPCIPQLGSVGASGDLTPLSYVAAVLSGEREVWSQGCRRPAREALDSAGVLALTLEAKESLAIMNGTSAMTGVAALSVPRALFLARWVSALTAAASDVLLGQPRHYDPRIFYAKPHPGQALCAQWIRHDLEFETARDEAPARVQDRYSLRCAPHVVGVLLDVLPSITQTVEIEVGGANDNPLVDPETGEVLHGGNFYGGHICSAMDTLKTQVANLADLMDRQLSLLCHPETNNGLPVNLVGAPEAERSAHHGFKAMQITASALAAECAKLSMPASVFSRSTENHNQDKVSMGTIAARDCSYILDLTENVAAILTLSVVQAVDLRGGSGCHRRARKLHEAVRSEVPFVDADREMRADIDKVIALAKSGALPIGKQRLSDLPGLEQRR